MSTALDTNLAALLRRHVPVVASARFREMLRARFLDEAARLSAERSGTRGAAPRAPVAPVIRLPVLRAALLAAASLVALLSAAFWLASAPTDVASLHAALADTGVAERRLPDGPWQPASGPALALGASDFLELASDGRGEVTVDVPLIGTVALQAGEPARATLRRLASGAVSILLGAGRGELRAGSRSQELSVGRELVIAPEMVGSDRGGPDLPRLPEALDAQPAPLVPDVPPPAPVAGELHGRVTEKRDAPEPEPLPEFRLVMVSTDITKEGPKSYSREVEDPDGRFRWAGVPPGRYHLYVQAEGRAVHVTRHVTIDPGLLLPSIEVVLETGLTLRGRVLDREGRPVAGAVVVSDTDAPAIMLGLLDANLDDVIVARDLTDADGRFEIPHLTTASQQVLRASAPGHGPAWVEAEAGASEVELRLPQGAAVEGTARNLDGTPRPGVLLVASFPSTLAAAHCMTFGGDFADADGNYRIDGLPAQAGVVLLLDESGSPNGLPPMQPVTLRPGVTTRVDFGDAPEPGAEGIVRGFATEADGAPAKGRMISVMPVGATEYGSDWTGSMVDEQGVWRIEHLAPGLYEVYVVYGVDGTVTHFGEVRVPDRAEVRFDVRLPGGSLAGAVTRPDSSPLPHAFLIVEQRDLGGEWTFIARVVSDEAGRWTAQALPAGMYRATAFDWQARMGAARSGPVAVGLGPVTGLDLRLGAGGKLLVRVRDASGAPVADAEVQLRDARGAPWSLDEHQATNAEGLLHFDSVPVGAWEVEATAPGRPPVRVRVEQLADQTVTADLTVPIPP